VRDAYGELRDGLNVGLASDRFQVDWWINSQRVFHRLGKQPRQRLDLAHFLSAEAPIINRTQPGVFGWPIPPKGELSSWSSAKLDPPDRDAILLVEIPSDFQALKASDPPLAADWRQHTRMVFKNLFKRGYLVTDFVYVPGAAPRSFYVLSHGESTF
jgi:predicted GNAT superfamily acetyltransferase